MKKFSTLFFALILCLITSHAQNYQWAKSMGGTSSDYGNSIAVDASGNVYTTGSFKGTVDFNPGPANRNLKSAGLSDIFISKIDAAGNFIWAKKMGSTGTDFGHSIVLDDTGNIYITGLFNETVDFDPGAGNSSLTSAGSNDIFVSKLDSAGNFIWAKSMGGPDSERGKSIAVDGAGNVYISGFFNETCDFDPGVGISNLTSNGLQDIFISKLDANGNFIWAKSMGNSGYDNALAMTIDGLGNVYLTGLFQETVDFDPGIGTSNLTCEGMEDIFITKLDSAGTFLWAKSIGGVNREWGNSIAIDGSGNVYTTGMFYETVDFDPGAGTSYLSSEGGDDIFILKLNSEGNFLWAKSMGGTEGDWANSIGLDGSGNVYTTGWFEETVDFDPNAGTSYLTSAGFSDIFILKLDAAGNFLWVKSMGGAGYDLGESIFLDGFGNVLLTAKFEETVDFDPGVGTNNLTSNGLEDIAIIKLESGSVGISEKHFENTLSVYPNPTKDAVNIDLGMEYDGTINVLVRNLLGQEIMRNSFNQSNALQLSIPGEAGMYFIEISTGDKTALLKVVKE